MVKEKMLRQKKSKQGAALNHNTATICPILRTSPVIDLNLTGWLLHLSPYTEPGQSPFIQKTQGSHSPSNLATGYSTEGPDRERIRGLKTFIPRVTCTVRAILFLYFYFVLRNNFCISSYVIIFVCIGSS